MTSDLTACPCCGAILAPWERRGCRCDGPRHRGHAELLYAVACMTAMPIHIRDHVRLVERDHGHQVTEARDKIRTVRENARALKFEQADFETD